MPRKARQLTLDAKSSLIAEVEKVAAQLGLNPAELVAIAVAEFLPKSAKGGDEATKRQMRLLKKKIVELEENHRRYEATLAAVIDMLGQAQPPPPETKRRIGF